MNSAGPETAQWHGVSATRRNRIRGYDKPNEDLALADDRNRFYLVLDGVSRTPRPGRPYASPSPAAEAALLFASTVHSALAGVPAPAAPLTASTPAPSPPSRSLRPSLSPAERLRRAAAAGNAALADYNRRTFPVVDYLENNPAGCVGVLALIEGGLLHYAWLGDSSGRVLHADGTATHFTRSQTARLSARLPSLGLSGDERTICIRRDICNNPAHECGYGVFNGSPAALDFLVTGSLPLAPTDIVLLATDGLDPLLDSVPPAALAPFDPDDLLARTEQIEDQRPDLRSDDKSVVLIRSRNWSANRLETSEGKS